MGDEETIRQGPTSLVVILQKQNKLFSTRATQGFSDH